MPAVYLDHFLLNQHHDHTIVQVVKLAITRIEEQSGPPPCSFSFFVMGSAGRFEQSIWSDQDHGIIYQDQTEETKAYFLTLGEEISNGLYHAGYPYCDGAVMANNPLWCKSVIDWQQQLADWMLEASWESIRHLLIFIDSRSLFGEKRFVEHLKSYVFQYVSKEHLLKKILDNTLYLKKGVGVFGQFLPETHGQHSGSINIKETAFLPYVNAIRILAIKANIIESPTLSRLELIPEKYLPASKKKLWKQQFLLLLNYRLSLGDHKTYETGHYLKIGSFPNQQKKELKEILKNAVALSQHVKILVKKENENGNE
jgi:CBS domain-containing protein